MNNKNVKKSNRFVCRECFNRIEKCTCEFHPLYLIHMDIELQEHIRVLNEKGYRTVSCCCGHDLTDVYISFAFDYFKDYEDDMLPRNFKYTSNKHGFVLRCKIKKSEDTTEFRKQTLKDLLKFCKNLDARNSF